MNSNLRDPERPTPTPEDWGSQAHVHTLVMLAITLIALYLCFRMLVPFLSALAWALALAVLVMPLHRRLEARFKSVNLVAAVSVLIAALIVVVPVILVTVNMIDEAVIGVGHVQVQVTSGHWRSLIAEHPQLTALVDWIDIEFDIPGTVTAASGTLSDIAGNIVKGSLQQVVELLLIFYFLFYFLRDRRAALTSIRFLSPLSAPQMARLFERVSDTLHATLYGTFSVAMVQGALGGLMFWALGLPAPLLWGMVMGLLAIVPVLGAFLIWIPAAAFLLLTGHPVQALILAVWGTVMVGGIDNVLYPILVGNRLHMHTMQAFISIVGGLFVFGAAGLILGPVVLTTTTALFEVWRYPEASATE
ncbi:MAG: AI-2E family transporter [Xanthomonadaceae bacterium]|nr:AI-2E family transporter [Xanthomonadaceae bacterium]MDP2185604.1 AI-2E family transporter [Xanthomonadales bacterium]MDZ4115516.1 AI-2E family transporter [Xanthomonadaceae bacterium]MDZ4378261.1 AI-2E family transporter [Xanthomonadaceae bacterium]